MVLGFISLLTLIPQHSSKAIPGCIISESSPHTRAIIFGRKLLSGYASKSWADGNTLRILNVPLDHFVSQVHLRNFAANDGMLRVIKKSDLKAFPAKPQDVCRVMDGNNNPFLKQERLVEEYLKEIEPRYNTAVQKVRDDNIDAEAIHTIAGFVAYVIICSPTGGRLHSKPLQERLLVEAKRLEAEGVLQPSPKELGNKMLSELVEDGVVRFDVDPKFPQAIGVEDFHNRISVFGNAKWEVLINDQECGAYFTSDFPVAIEPIDINTPINRVFPLSPDLAIRIIPDLAQRGRKPDMKFSGFNCVRRKELPRGVKELNRRLVQCAEDMVFFGRDDAWIPKFVAKHRSYRIEPITIPIVIGGFRRHLITQRIRKANLA